MVLLLLLLLLLWLSDIAISFSVLSKCKKNGNVLQEKR